MSDTDVNLARFYRVPLLVELELGHFALNLESILRLREGDVLRIDQPAGVPLRVMAGGVELGFADLVTLENQVAARITRISHQQVARGPNGNS
jgi:flagellar motor switch/type III secretory pathway protein FliN